ncbi:MAG: hypothetical protein EOP37_03595 [Rubrivivax sp.]|nr:MAG: hypothetical protein EOP37_03595 [Rubrivivax sp.]
MSAITMYLQSPHALASTAPFDPMSGSGGGFPSVLPAPEASWTGRRILSACLLLACRIGRHDEAAPIGAALARDLGDERAVKVLMAVGALLGGDASVGRSQLASEQHSGEADAATLVFAMVDRLAGGQHEWRPLVERVLSTSSDPTWRAIAYAIEQIG